jgi:hypothetical protein
MLTEASMSDADVIARMLHAIDAFDWVTVRHCFTDEVSTDYTSLWGGEPEQLFADDLVARWTEFASGFAATQHHSGPIVAFHGLAETHVVAYHSLPETEGGDVWTVHGHYVARLADGKIAELALHTFRAGGHEGLPSSAARRAGESGWP